MTDILSNSNAVDSPKRLLFISPVGFIGGAERVLLECVRQVRQRRPGWSVTVLLLDDGPLQQAVVELGATARVVPMPSFLSQRGDSKLIVGKATQGTRSSRVRSMLAWPGRVPDLIRYFVKLRAALREFRPDLMHSNGLKSHLLTAATQPKSSRVFWHIHDFYSHRPKIQSWIRRLSKKAICCVAISQAVADDIAVVIPDKPVYVLENCVDTIRFSPGPPEVERMDQAAGLNSSFSGLRIGLVATYANWKGHDVFLKALAEVPNVRGYIIGGPIYSTAGSQWSESELRGMAKELKIEDRVGLIPFQSDPTWLYRSLDIVVHASVRPEPFGLTIIEAMACGRPVVVSDAGGAHDLFIEGVTGLGHQPGDVASLVKAIRLLVDDAGLRQRVAQAARQTAEVRFSTDRFGETLINMYENALIRNRT